MFFKKSDILIIAVIIVLAAAGWFIYRHLYQDKPAKAEIYYYSELVKTVSLKKGVNETFTIPQDENVVFRLYEDGSISFIDSDCPDKICIGSGKLRMVGETAACLPNGIILKIVPEQSRSKNDIDIVAR